MDMMAREIRNDLQASEGEVRRLEQVLADPALPPWQRDAVNTDAWVDFLRTRDAARPFLRVAVPGQPQQRSRPSSTSASRW